jgi:hypothetical protein
VSRAGDHRDRGLAGCLVFHPMMGGMAYELGQRVLPLVVDDVIPAVQTR